MQVSFSTIWLQLQLQNFMITIVIIYVLAAIIVVEKSLYDDLWISLTKILKNKKSIFKIFTSS